MRGAAAIFLCFRKGNESVECESRGNKKQAGSYDQFLPGIAPKIVPAAIVFVFYTVLCAGIGMSML